MASNKKITFKKTLWGWKMKIPHHMVKKLTENSDIVDLMTSAGSAGALALGMASPIVALVVVYIKLHLVIIKRLDKGKGVYLSKYFIGGLVPSTVE